MHRRAYFINMTGCGMNMSNTIRKERGAIYLDLSDCFYSFQSSSKHPRKSGRKNKKGEVKKGCNVREGSICSNSIHTHIYIQTIAVIHVKKE
jgi:hypothetical protein